MPARMKANGNFSDVSRGVTMIDGAWGKKQVLRPNVLT